MFRRFGAVLGSVQDHGSCEEFRWRQRAPPNAEEAGSPYQFLFGRHRNRTGAAWIDTVAGQGGMTILRRAGTGLVAQIFDGERRGVALGYICHARFNSFCYESSSS
jgi:hypothetical protein